MGKASVSEIGNMYTKRAQATEGRHEREKCSPEEEAAGAAATGAGLGTEAAGAAAGVGVGAGAEEAPEAAPPEPVICNSKYLAPDSAVSFRAFSRWKS